MAKKNLQTLAKELDFATPYEYYGYCIDSYINGNKQQCRDLFNAMKKEDRKGLIKYIEQHNDGSNYTEVENFYFNLL